MAPRASITLLSDTGSHSSDRWEADGEDLWLDAGDLLPATGFELKPEGLCRAEACFPLAQDQDLVRAGRVNIAGFWRHRGGAAIHTDDRTVWVLAEPPAERSARLQSLEAPDFTLPDARGELHSLSDLRGRKVLLATWASW